MNRYVKKERKNITAIFTITFLFNANYVGQKSNRFRNNNKSSYTLCTEGSRPTFRINTFLFARPKTIFFVFLSRQAREPRPLGTTKYNRFSALTLPVGEFPKTSFLFPFFFDTSVFSFSNLSDFEGKRARILKIRSLQ